MSRTSTKVTLNFGLFSIEGEWTPNNKEKEAAWEMYVELITRISVEKLNDDDGTLRESFNSLYSLFDTTRSILRKYGPDVAKPDRISFGLIAISALNGSLRPFLSKWHPLLKDYEEKNEGMINILDYEKKWKYYKEVRKRLNSLSDEMTQYADQLAKISGVELLHKKK
jgi:hypothetical protein